MTTTTTPDDLAAKVRELAGKAADELARRGLARGVTARTQVYVEGLDVFEDVPLTECRVCMLGAMGAAMCGDPEAGYGDAFTGSDADVYGAFLRAVAAALPADRRRDRMTDPTGIIPDYSDRLDADQVDDAVAIFRKVAAS